MLKLNHYSYRNTLAINLKVIRETGGSRTKTKSPNRNIQRKSTLLTNLIAFAKKSRFHNWHKFSQNSTKIKTTIRSDSKRNMFPRHMFNDHDLSNQRLDLQDVIIGRKWTQLFNHQFRKSKKATT